MKSLSKALLIAGLFFTSAQAQESGGIDWTKSTSLVDGYVYTCNGMVPNKPTYTTSGYMPLGECLGSAAQYVSAQLPALPKSTFSDNGGGNTVKTQVSVTALPKPSPVTESGYSVGFRITQTTTTTSCTGDANGNPVCATRTDPPYEFSISGSVGVGDRKPAQVCPDSHPNQAADDNGVQKCYADLPLLPCDQFAGLSSNKLVESFKATTGLYSAANPPQCLRKCHTNKDGYEQCGNCKVVAKSWSSTTDGNKERWWANVGTYTGNACGFDESTKKPDEPPPVCWKTRNGLDMCQADPDKKCTVVNGVRQCQAGCGEINGDFFCKDNKLPSRDIDRTGDKDALPIDDTIADPSKALGDMVKGDFKDVLKGVETRVSASVQGISNLENSVDTGNNTLLDIKDVLEAQSETEEAQTDQLGEINSKLGQIADGMGSEGSGEGEGEGEGEGGDCDPNKSPDCVRNAGVKSWWTSSYEEGLEGLVSAKMSDFKQSEAYANLNAPLELSGGGAQPRWNFCMNLGFADYGCNEITIPDFIWHFIKACMLFGAAILCRRLLIGA